MFKMFQYKNIPGNFENISNYLLIYQMLKHKIIVITFE